VVEYPDTCSGWQLEERHPSATRQYFQADQKDPVESFIAEAGQHPVFELTPIGPDSPLLSPEGPDPELARPTSPPGSLPLRVGGA